MDVHISHCRTRDDVVNKKLLVKLMSQARKMSLLIMEVHTDIATSATHSLYATGGIIYSIVFTNKNAMVISTQIFGKI